MTASRRCRVVLLSRVPRAYSNLIAGLRGRGAGVCVPRDDDHSVERIESNPDFVLVDLVHGAGLTPRLVDRLNRLRSATVVLALHDGSLGRFLDESAGLSVKGFCDAGDTRPIVRAITEHRLAVGSTLH